MADLNSDDLRKKWSKSLPDETAWDSGDPTLTYKPGQSDVGSQTTLDSDAFLGTDNTLGPAPARCRNLRPNSNEKRSSSRFCPR